MGAGALSAGAVGSAGCVRRRGRRGRCGRRRAEQLPHPGQDTHTHPSFSPCTRRPSASTLPWISPLGAACGPPAPARCPRGARTWALRSTSRTPSCGPAPPSPPSPPYPGERPGPEPAPARGRSSRTAWAAHARVSKQPRGVRRSSVGGTSAGLPASAPQPLAPDGPLLGPVSRRLCHCQRLLDPGESIHIVCAGTRTRTTWVARSRHCACAPRSRTLAGPARSCAPT
jgi:hypothetical protein